jgi:hypothetical protein
MQEFNKGKNKIWSYVATPNDWQMINLSSNCGTEGFSKSEEIKEIQQREVNWEKEQKDWKAQRFWEYNQKNKEKYLKQDALSLLQKSLVLVTRDFQPIFHKKTISDGIIYFENQFGSKERALEWINEIEKVAKDIVKTYADRWIPLLIDSLSMHWFPERVEKGVRRPGEWKPDFNLEVVARMEYECGKTLAYRIKDTAWNKGLDKRELLSLFPEKVKE